MKEQLTDAATSKGVLLIHELGDLLIDSRNLIPLVLAFGLGWLYSLSPKITRMNRISDKKFHVYSCNVIVVIVGFVILNYDAEPKTLMASLMFVIGASVLLPAAYFKWIHKGE